MGRAALLNDDLFVTGACESDINATSNVSLPITVLPCVTVVISSYSTDDHMFKALASYINKRIDHWTDLWSLDSVTRGRCNRLIMRDLMDWLSRAARGSGGECLGMDHGQRG